MFLALVGILVATQTEPNLRKSLVFTEVARVDITGNTYIVPYKINITEILNPLYEARVTVQYLEKSISAVQTIWRGQSTWEVGTLLKAIDDQINDFKEFVQFSVTKSPFYSVGYQTRSKRGALNFVGEVGNALFGTATQEQIDQIHNILNKQKSLTEEERQQLNLHSQILNVTTAQIDKLDHAVGNLRSTVNSLVSNVSLLSARDKMWHELNNVLLFTNNVISSRILFSNFRTHLTNVKLGINQMLEHKLSPFLVPTHTLLQLLSEASVVHPGLLYPPRPEYVGLYRDIIRIVPKSSNTDNIFYFYIMLPLRGLPGSSFDLFQIHSLPVSVPNTSYFGQIEVKNKFFAVSQDRSTYTMFDQLTDCNIHNHLYVCPPTGPLYTSAVLNCVAAIFFNDPISVNICPTTLFTHYHPIFIDTNDGWVYSTPTPISFSLNCPAKKLTQNLVEVSHTGILRIPAGCGASSSSITLPATSQTTGRGTTLSAVPLKLNIKFPSAAKTAVTRLNITASDEPILQTSTQQLVHQLRMIKAAQPENDVARHLQGVTIASVAGVTLLMSVILMYAGKQWYEKSRNGKEKPTAINDVPDVRFSPSPQPSLPPSTHDPLQVESSQIRFERGRSKLGGGVCRSHRATPTEKQINEKHGNETPTRCPVFIHPRSSRLSDSSD